MTDTHQVGKEEVEAKAPLKVDDINSGPELMAYLNALPPRYGSPHMHDVQRAVWRSVLQGHVVPPDLLAMVCAVISGKGYAG